MWRVLLMATLLWPATSYAQPTELGSLMGGMKYAQCGERNAHLKDITERDCVYDATHVILYEKDKDLVAGILASTRYSAPARTLARFEAVKKAMAKKYGIGASVEGTTARTWSVDGWVLYVNVLLDAEEDMYLVNLGVFTQEYWDLVM